MAKGKRSIMEVSPIDYVATMVFHDDKEWQGDFLKVSSQYNENNLREFVRFRSWNTEELLIRCVRKFMPFIRNVYIILARESQKKAWMDELGVIVVYHRDIIPEKYLPTFNSCAIEMFLHRIPGLSERFIYGNDDMFPISPLTEKDFFEGDVPCISYGYKPFPSDPNIFHRSCRNGLNFVASEFGMRFDDTMLRGGHSITPMLKSTWEYLWHRGGKDIEASISPFRTPNNFNQWLCPWWHFLSGNYYDRVPKRVYVSTDTPLEKVKEVMTCEDAGIVCVNDNESEKDYMKYGRVVIAALEEKLK